MRPIAAWILRLPLHPTHRRVARDAPLISPLFSFLLGAALVAYFLALYYFGGRTQHDQLDFGSFYVWGYAARHGINPYSAANVSLIAKHLHLAAQTANYPPPFVLILCPFSLLSPLKAYWLWSSLNPVSLVIAV